MAKWTPKFPIDYSPRGDDIDTFAQKTKAELELIYNLLNVLRQNSAASGNLKNVEPYQFHVDTSNGKLFIRDSTNTEWHVIGNVNEDYFGITARNIGAIANDGTIGKISAGTTKPTDAQTGDMFYSFEERRLYWYAGAGWEIFLSLNFADMYDYENYCVARAEVDYSGKNKIPRLDRFTGKGNFDIAGSADKILGYSVETANLKDGQILKYDAKNKKFVPADKDYVTAAKPTDGDILVFRKSKNSFRLEPKGTAGEGKLLTFTKNNEPFAEYSGAQEVSVEIGAAEKLSQARKIELAGHAEGEVLFDGSSDVKLVVSNVSASLADEADYAAKAEKFATARKIGIGGLVKAAAVTFDGTRDITLNVTNVDKLTTARKIELSGDAEGFGQFDGSSDVKIILTVNQAKAATAAASAVIATRANQDARGNVIDETYATKAEVESKQMTVVDKYLGEYAKTAEVEKIYAKSADCVKLSDLASMTAKLKAASADKLSTARTISLTGAMKGAVQFDGSGNAEIEIEPTAEMTITPAELAAIFYF